MYIWLYLVSDISRDNMGISYFIMFYGNYSGVCTFNSILSRFLQLTGKNSAKIKLVFHLYHGFASVVTNFTPLLGLYLRRNKIPFDLT